MNIQNFVSQRKPNLFYTDGPDSYFLTLSNYSENLTGSFLSTSHKLFPTKFLCCYIDGINEYKEDFIKTYLVGNYENKMSYLHDYYLNKNEIPEDNIYPLSDLLKTINMFVNGEKNIKTINTYIYFYKDNVKMYYTTNSNSNNITNLFVTSDESIATKFVLKRTSDNHWTLQTEVNEYAYVSTSQESDGSIKFSNSISETETNRYLFDIIQNGDVYKIKSLWMNKFLGSNDSNEVSANYAETALTNNIELHIEQQINPVVGNTFEIVHVGEITEQDYNGTFTDTICLINASDITSAKISYNKGVSNYVNYDIDITHLYNWTENGQYVGPSNYEDTQALVDGIDKIVVGTENIYSYYDSSSYYFIETNNTIVNNITFNAIIPLYDMVDVDPFTNTNIILDNTINNALDLNNENHINTLEEQYKEDVRNDNNMIYSYYNYNVPMGIWIPGKDITLTNDLTNNVGQTWSLLISSQFKPMPNSSYHTTNLYNDNSVEAFATFAEILCKNRLLSENMSYLINLNNALVEKVNNLESKLYNQSSYNIDTLSMQLLELQQKHENDVNTLNQRINEITNLQWVNDQENK